MYMYMRVHIWTIENIDMSSWLLKGIWQGLPALLYLIHFLMSVYNVFLSLSLSFSQELALFGDFTMLETMYYFGILHGLSIKKIKERGQFLLELLELPSVNKIIRKLR